MTCFAPREQRVGRGALGAGGTGRSPARSPCRPRRLAQRSSAASRSPPPSSARPRLLHSGTMKHRRAVLALLRAAPRPRRPRPAISASLPQAGAGDDQRPLGRARAPRRSAPASAAQLVATAPATAGAAGVERVRRRRSPAGRCRPARRGRSPWPARPAAWPSAWRRRAGPCSLLDGLAHGGVVPGAGCLSVGGLCQRLLRATAWRRARASIGAVLVTSSPSTSTASAAADLAQRGGAARAVLQDVRAIGRSSRSSRSASAAVEALRAHQRAQGEVGLQRRPRRADADRPCPPRSSVRQRSAPPRPAAAAARRRLAAAAAARIRRSLLTNS